MPIDKKCLDQDMDQDDHSNHTVTVTEHMGEFWDMSTQGHDIKVDHLGPRPWGHHHTSSAHPP